MADSLYMRRESCTTDDIGGTITISGDVVFTVHYLPVVGGNLFTVGGAAERVAFNPPEDTYLLVFGEAKQNLYSSRQCWIWKNNTIWYKSIRETHRTLCR